MSTKGRIFGNIRGDQSISYQAMEKKFIQFVNIIRSDPAVAQVAGSIGGGGGGRGGGATNTGQLFITLKPPAERGHISSDDVIDRLRPKFDAIAGARMFMSADEFGAACGPAGARAMGRCNTPCRPTRWTN